MITSFGLLLLATLARAEEPEPCATVLPTPPERVSVAWVSPVADRVGAGAWLEVVPTSELRAWLATERGAGVGRLLQRLGERKKANEPRRRWKVVVFDVDRDDLCRPIDGSDETDIVDGVSGCPGGLGRARRHYAGCGVTTDRRDGGAGFVVYRVTWRDAARDGFCVLPADRFVAEAPR